MDQSAGQENSEEHAATIALARDLLRRGGPAALATLEPAGGPFASYVMSASGEDGSPLLLLSRLAVHSRNLAQDARSSLLLVREPAPGGEAMTAARLTLTGRCAEDGSSESREKYLARHPDAARYAGFGDFKLYRFNIGAAHLVAGFGRIVSLPPGKLLGPAETVTIV